MAADFLAKAKARTDLRDKRSTSTLSSDTYIPGYTNHEAFTEDAIANYQERKEKANRLKERKADADDPKPKSQFRRNVSFSSEHHSDPSFCPSRGRIAHQ